jgi:hypothetical protein
MSVSFLINLRDINTRSAFLTKSAFLTPSAVSWGVGIEYNNNANIGFTVANAPNDCSALWNTPGGSGTQIQTSTSIQNNNWYHVTLVYNEGVQNIYLNGQLEDTYTDSWGFLNQCPNANLRMGGWWQNDIISVQGKMDEVRFYDRVLSPAEISLLTAQVD